MKRASISLNTLATLILLLIAVVPVAWASSKLTPYFDGYFITAKATTGYDLRVSKRLITYRLQSDKPVTFSFSRPLKLFRVLSSAALVPGVKQNQTGWVYGYQVEMLDGLGRTIGKHIIYSRSVIRDRAFQDQEKVRFYRSVPNAITLDDNALIVSERPVAAIRLTQLVSDTGVSGIDARVYERRPLSSSAALAAFRRRSADEQAELARTNAFPADLLTEEEMTNIARNQWRPIGPVGIESRDYKMLVMYEYTKPRSARKEQDK